MQAYEYRQGPTAGLGDVDPVFFQELARYLQAHHLVDLLGLQVLADDVPPTMSEFVLADNDTVMLNERDVKARGTPFHITGFFLEEPGITELKNGVPCTNCQRYPPSLYQQDRNGEPAFGYPPK